MKIKINNKSRERFCLLIAFISFLLILESKAQSIQRQSIVVCGTNMLSNGILIKQSIGQAYATGAFYNNGIKYTPGFQQPIRPIMRINFSNEEFTGSNIKLTVFPNPATYSVNVETSEVIPNASLKVIDSNGRLFLNEKVSELKSYSVNSIGWPRGFYMVTISNDQKMHYSTKLMIK